MKSRENLIGAWTFLVGVILAIILGIFNSYMETTQSTLIYSVLVILGVIIGIVNVSDKDCMTFLIASLALVIVSGLGNQTLIFISNIAPILKYLTSSLSALQVMFMPATIVVALKAVFAITNN